jgi:hypothetical protein
MILIGKNSLKIIPVRFNHLGLKEEQIDDRQNKIAIIYLRPL